MKKNLFKVALVAAFGLFTSYNVYNSQKSVEMSDIALTNVEALAQFLEDPTYADPFCYIWMAKTYEDNPDKIYAFSCDDCQLYPVTNVWGNTYTCR